MVKKMAFLLLVLVGPALWQTQARCFAQTTDLKALFEQAEKYEDTGKYEEAEATYKKIVTEYPGTDDALEAQEKLTVLYISWDKEGEAEAAFQGLLANFADSEGIAKAVDHAADAYRESEKYEKALELYKQVVNNWPEAEHAMRSQVAVAKLNIKLGDETAAQAGIDKLIADFSDHKDIADGLDSVADAYRDCKKYGKALELYKYVVNRWPESEQAIGSQVSFAELNIRLGKEEEAAAAVDKLIADFSDNNDVAEAVDHIADVFREEKRYEKARELYEYVVDRWPKAEHAADSLSGVVRTSLLLRDDPNAEAGTEELLTKFADNRNIAKVTHQLADNYRGLRKYEKARELYQHVVDNWPDAECVAECQAGVVRSYILLGDDPNAQAAIDKLIADFSSSDGLRDALREIAEEYERCGNYVQAKGFYQQITEDAERGDGNEPKLDTAKAQILFFINDGNDTAAFEAIDRLIVDCDNHPDLAKIVYQIAEKYYDIGRLYFN